MLRHEQLRSKGMNTNGLLHHVAVIHTRNLLDDSQRFAQETEAFLHIVTRPGDSPGHLCCIPRKTALKKGDGFPGRTPEIHLPCFLLIERRPYG